MRAARLLHGAEQRLASGAGRQELSGTIPPPRVRLGRRRHAPKGGACEEGSVPPGGRRGAFCTRARAGRRRGAFCTRAC
eukprot:6811130-Prymnesium_polylepis.1